MAVPCIPREDSEEKSDISDLEYIESETEEEISNSIDNPTENED